MDKDTFLKSIKSHSFYFSDEDNKKIEAHSILTLKACRLRCICCNTIIRIQPKEVIYPISFTEEELNLMWIYFSNTRKEFINNKYRNELKRLDSYYSIDCDENNIKSLLE